MTYRNRWHCRSTARITYLLETIVGIDVVCIAAELAAQNPAHPTVIEGVPTLVVEILSPSDTQDDVHDKLASYRAAGVPLVWVVDPRGHTVTVYRPDALPVLFNESQEISGAPHLPGFQALVAKFFGV